MKVAINYANDVYAKAQHTNTETAYKKAKFDKVIEYAQDDIDALFLEKHKDIFNIKTGNGLWIWKSYIIKKTLMELEYGDYLFYCDAGALFTRPIDSLIEALEKSNQDIMTFETPFVERQWTKETVIDYFNVGNRNDVLDTCQRVGGYILIKKTMKAIQFFDEYYRICDENDFLLTSDLSSKDQDKGVIAARHDQSIFSILSKKYGLVPFRDPSEYGKHPRAYKSFMDMMNPKADIQYIFNKYENSNYPQVIWGHRSGNVKKSALLLSWCRSYLPDGLMKMVSFFNIVLYRAKEAGKHETR